MLDARVFSGVLASTMTNKTIKGSHVSKCMCAFYWSGVDRYFGLCFV